MSRVTILWIMALLTATAPPSRYPTMLAPAMRTTSSSSSASAKMPVIGPRRMALGEMDFINAQISPARQKSPFTRQR